MILLGLTSISLGIAILIQGVVLGISVKYLSRRDAPGPAAALYTGLQVIMPLLWLPSYMGMTVKKFLLMILIIVVMYLVNKIYFTILNNSWHSRLKFYTVLIIGAVINMIVL